MKTRSNVKAGGPTPSGTWILGHGPALLEASMKTRTHFKAGATGSQCQSMVGTAAGAQLDDTTDTPNPRSRGGTMKTRTHVKAGAGTVSELYVEAGGPRLDDTTDTPSRRSRGGTMKTRTHLKAGPEGGIQIKPGIGRSPRRRVRMSRSAIRREPDMTIRSNVKAGMARDNPDAGEESAMKTRTHVKAGPMDGVQIKPGIGRSSTVKTRTHVMAGEWDLLGWGSRWSRQAATPERPTLPAARDLELLRSDRRPRASRARYTSPEVIQTFQEDTMKTRTHVKAGATSVETPN